MEERVYSPGEGGEGDFQGSRHAKGREKEEDEDDRCCVTVVLEKEKQQEKVTRYKDLMR